MRTGRIPFQFDVTSILGRMLRKEGAPDDATSFRVPFLTVLAAPSELEQRIAAEVLIRLGDRRVLNAWECCDGCIDCALRSLQEIRAFLLEKAVELNSGEEGILRDIIDLMMAGIRQFLTFEQTLSAGEIRPSSDSDEFYRNQEIRQAYFDALEVLRGHLWRCLAQIAAVAKAILPSSGLVAEYQGAWQQEAYKPLEANDLE